MSAATDTASARAEGDTISAGGTRAVTDTASASADGDPVPPVYFDWSRDKTHALHGNAENVVIYYGLQRLLDALPGPTTIYCESTFESYEDAARQAFIDRCVFDGHDLRVINPRATAQRRRALDWEKSDEIDAHTIRNMALKTDKHFQRPQVRSAAMFDKLLAANRKLCVLRNTYADPIIGPKGGVTPVSKKDIYAAELALLLPDPALLTITQRLALCNEEEGVWSYARVVLAAVGVAAEFAENRREFDFITGLYENGYPSQVRSDLHWWRWGNSIASHKKNSVSTKMTWTDYRRELRRLFHTIKNVRAVPDPVMRGQRGTPQAGTRAEYGTASASAEVDPVPARLQENA